MEAENMTIVLVPKEEWAALVSVQHDILEQLKYLKTRETAAVPVKYITANEFMTAVRIGRTKFDELVKTNKIKTVKKRRKIYLPISEVQRFFDDVEVQ